MLQIPTTPGHFAMWKNADVPRPDVPPPSIKPSATEPYYTRSRKTNEFKISDEKYTYSIQMYPSPC